MGLALSLLLVSTVQANEKYCGVIDCQTCGVLVWKLQTLCDVEKRKGSGGGKGGIIAATVCGLINLSAADKSKKYCCRNAPPVRRCVERAGCSGRFQLTCRCVRYESRKCGE